MVLAVGAEKSFGTTMAVVVRAAAAAVEELVILGCAFTAKEVSQSASSVVGALELR
jgi:hypothetical protein